MAHYLIIADDETKHVEAKNMKEAAVEFFEESVHDARVANIYRVAGAPKRVTLSVETVTKVNVE